MKENPKGNAFGTFGGVFTPCALTILGVIMFLRFGYVVGNAGIRNALLIVIISKVITTLTTLSLSAIATNTRVKGGGAYYLISRSLGPEFGGAIGLVFFAAQALSVAMYVIGFTEVMLQFLPADTSPALVATITNLAVAGCVYLGAGWAIKVQFVILASVVLSLVAFFTGAIPASSWQLLTDNWAPGYQSGSSFWLIFAIFFPAVTGIMAGANMSGDLRKPEVAIPNGTLLAVLATLIIYVAMAIMLGASATREQLISNNLVVSEISASEALITLGVFAATLSSAIGSMMGAPRILQSLAADEVFDRLKYFGVADQDGEPRRAIIATALIAQAGMLAADLNSIAPLITMAFLLTYGLLNLATFYETITKNPSYRPTFRFSNLYTSALGTLGCAAVMLLIDWQWAILAACLLSGLYYYLLKLNLQAQWGDLNSGLLFERTRRNLMKLEDGLYHPKNWRPFVLALSGTAFSRPHLVIFGNWLTQESGMLLLGQVVPGDLEDQSERLINQEKILHTLIKDHSLQAFPAVLIANDYTAGVQALVQCQGLGRVRPNIVLMGCPLSQDRMAVFCPLLRGLAKLQRSIVILRQTDNPELDGMPPEGTIDVWWRGRANGELMVLLAHLMLTHPSWRGRELRLLRVIQNESAAEEVQQHLNQLLSAARLNGHVQAVASADPIKTIHQTSRDAAFVILGFAIPPPEDDAEFLTRIETLVGSLPRVAMVCSAGEMNLES